MHATAKSAGPAEPARVWHVLPLEAVFGHLASTPSGLSVAEASRRLAIHGTNELQGTLRVSPWTLLVAQFKNVLIVIGRRGACALPARPVRDVPLDAGGLGDRHTLGLHGLARVGVSQVVRTPGLVW
jgi:hypothetical protein